MASDKDEIKLTREDKQFLAHAERVTGRSWKTLLTEIVQLFRGSAPTEQLRGKQQKLERQRLFRELSSLPVQNSTDSFSGREHDEIIYEDK